MKIYDPKKILIPIDFSELSKGVLWAGVEVGKIRDAEVLVLHVGKETEDHPSYGGELSAIISLNRLRGETRKVLENRLQDMLKEVSAGPKAKSLILWGNPAKEILHIAETGDYDLIIMGTHGRNKLSRFLLGSVTEQVIRRAPCPVLIIRDKVATKQFIQAEVQQAAAE